MKLHDLTDIFSRNVFQFCSKTEESWQGNCDILIQNILVCQMMSLFQIKLIQNFFLSMTHVIHTIWSLRKNILSTPFLQIKIREKRLLFQEKKKTVQKIHIFLRNLPMRCVQKYVLFLLHDCWLAGQGHCDNGVQAAYWFSVNLLVGLW